MDSALYVVSNALMQGFFKVSDLNKKPFHHERLSFDYHLYKHQLICQKSTLERKPHDKRFGYQQNRIQIHHRGNATLNKVTKVLARIQGNR